jgi:hypothetical protein
MSPVAAYAPSPRRLRDFARSIALIVVGLIIGFGTARLADDPHTARAESLTGTVTWSNQQIRLIAFDPDGAVHHSSDGATFYSVVSDDWQDADGTLHTTGDYPRCLAANKGGAVSTDRRRVELEVVNGDTGGVQPQRIAVHVHCLD